MIVCVCHRVSESDIVRAAHAGCESFDELQFELSVATSCGRCHDCARETFYRHTAPPGLAVPQTCCEGHDHPPAQGLPVGVVHVHPVALAAALG